MSPVINVAVTARSSVHSISRSHYSQTLLSHVVSDHRTPFDGPVCTYCVYVSVSDSIVSYLNMIALTAVLPGSGGVAVLVFSAAFIESAVGF